MKDKDAEKWRQARERGFRAWVVQRGILGWGVPMLVFFVFMQSSRHQGDLMHILMRNIPIWLVAGLFFGVATWFAMERQYRRYLAKKAQTNDSAT